MSELTIPRLSLVVLIGISGSGKSTFAARHFGWFEVISSDFCRGLVADDENDQSATPAAFDVLNYIATKRLAAGRLTVVDATNVQPESRRKLVQLARSCDVLPVAIVLDVPDSVAIARNAVRADRRFGAEVIRRQRDQLRRGLRGLEREGFRTVHVLRGVDEIDAATIVRTPLRCDLSHLTGPFDVIGDVHGCRGELEELLARLGYTLVRDTDGRCVNALPPPGRSAVFLGDLVDRGPDTPGVLRLVMGMVGAGNALAVAGNHEAKLVRALAGHSAQLTHGLAQTLSQLEAEPAEFREQVRAFCDGLVTHLVLDGGRLVVAHAGLKEAYHGRASGRVRAFALYGDTTGETDEYGLPVRYPWAREYRGRAMVLYGHTPVRAVEWVNNTMCLDTGCVFGGQLTALRYPEREVVSVPAQRVWYEPSRPLLSSGGDEDLLDLDDVLGRRGVSTPYLGRIAIREEQSAGALEVMSRFALDPRWIPYLPPTMAPGPASTDPDLLEDPTTAFAAYRSEGVERLICEEKHMGSRAVVYVQSGGGTVYTRTGRPFFPADLTAQLVDRVRAAASTAGLFAELNTDWLLLDCELLPWSAKAEDLLRHQYAAVGAAARTALPAAVAVLDAAAARGLEVTSLAERTRARVANANAFCAVYRRYCWPVSGLDGVALAPFQLLATAGATYHDRDHGWHLALADRLVAADPDLFRATRRLLVDARDPASCEAGVAWWRKLTEAGGEGMVVKPLANLTRTSKGLAQPGIKVRGREYLRLIYGPDYTEAANLARLRQRSLGHKRSLALREYALGLTALERFVAGEPLWRIHEAVFAILALESEPIDPRL